MLLRRLRALAAKSVSKSGSGSGSRSGPAYWDTLPIVDFEFVDFPSDLKLFLTNRLKVMHCPFLFIPIGMHRCQYEIFQISKRHDTCGYICIHHKPLIESIRAHIEQCQGSERGGHNLPTPCPATRL